MEITDLVEKNTSLLRLGLHLEFNDARHRVAAHLQRNIDRSKYRSRTNNRLSRRRISRILKKYPLEFMKKKVHCYDKQRWLFSRISSLIVWALILLTARSSIFLTLELPFFGNNIKVLDCKVFLWRPRPLPFSCKTHTRKRHISASPNR